VPQNLLKSISIASAVLVVGIAALLLGGLPTPLPAGVAVLCFLFVALAAISRDLFRFSPAALVLLAFTEGSSGYTLVAAALAVLLVALTLHLTSNPASPLAPVVSMLLASTTGFMVFAATPIAVFVAVSASLLTASSVSRVLSASMWSFAASLCAGAMFLASVPVLAYSSELPAVLAVSLIVGLAFLVLLVVSVRRTGTPAKLATAALAAVLLTLPVAFTSPSSDSDLATGLSASPNLEECAALGGDTIKSVECYSAVLIDEYRTNGLPATIRLVERAYTAPMPLGPHFAENCHESLHFLGKATALSTTGEIRDVISEGTDMCSAGFGHGIWEMAYGSMSTEALVQKVPTICRGWEGLNRSAEGSSGIGCRHILGHTLATRYRTHIEDIAAVCLIRDPDADPNSELTQDETISQNNCLAGLFMENFLDLNRFRTTDVDAAHPFTTCEHPKIAADSRLLWGCYNEVGAMVVPWSDFDLKKSLEACRDQVKKFSIPEFVEVSCYDSITRSIGPAIDRDPASMQKACSGITDPRLLTYCVTGIAAVLAFDSNDIAAARNLCSAVLTTPTAAETCLKRVEEISQSLAASEVAGDGDSTASTTDDSGPTQP